VTESGLVASLLARIHAESVELGLHVIVAAMEPRLRRLLRRMHFIWSPMGRSIEYYGEVRPCFTSVIALGAACRRAGARLAQRGVAADHGLEGVRIAPARAA
jgi:N-acyl-L-homoserine lactone synthetase